MNKAHIFLMASFAALLTAAPAAAQRVTPDQAARVAHNWVTLQIARHGAWGGSLAADVQAVQELRRGKRLVGYFVPVRPQGYVIVSLRRELEAVKAYSDTDTLDPKSDGGMADLIKGGMERIINAVEAGAGPIDTARTEDVVKLLETDHRTSWKALELDAAAFEASLSGSALLVNYQEGGILVETSWHQQWPYNDQCPNLGCASPGLNGRAYVGCVATAGAQIMRYWHWPPYGSGSPYSDTYDWINMPIRASGTSTAAEINAVAELCHEVGLAVGMDYGCDGSSAYTYDMEEVYEDNFRYSTSCAVRDRPDYSASDWFDKIRNDLNANRPLQYRIEGHSIVCDGWQEIPPSTKQYHMNYGWDNSRNAWYTLDALYQPGGGTTDDEYLVEDIKPVTALGAVLSGSYPLEGFPYRYFDMDTTCTDGASFAAGHFLQFLPNVTVTGASAANPVRINGTSAANTRLFTRADTSRGVLISGAAAIKLTSGGTVVLR